LRELLQESKNLSQIISFGANQVFEDKTTYTCLLILHKKEQENFEYHEVENFEKWKTRDISKTDFDTIKTDSLENDVWVLVPAKLKKVLNKINEKTVSLDKLVGEENIFNGIQTSANKIYIHKPINEDNDYYFVKSLFYNLSIENQSSILGTWLFLILLRINLKTLLCSTVFLLAQHKCYGYNSDNSTSHNDSEGNPLTFSSGYTTSK
jgi:hypothetical protein